jgi:hypothetical protein
VPCSSNQWHWPSAHRQVSLKMSSLTLNHRSVIVTSLVMATKSTHSKLMLQASRVLPPRRELPGLPRHVLDKALLSLKCLGCPAFEAGKARAGLRPTFAFPAMLQSLSHFNDAKATYYDGNSAHTRPRQKHCEGERTYAGVESHCCVGQRRYAKTTRSMREATACKQHQFALGLSYGALS